MTENLPKMRYHTAVELAEKESKIIKSGTGREYYDSNRHSLRGTTTSAICTNT